jgi:hypothetical protein
VATRSGAIEIIAEERDDLLIESGASSTSELELGDLGRVVIRPRRRGQAVVVRCPVGSDVSAATGSAPIQLRGSFGRAPLDEERSDSRRCGAGRRDEYGEPYGGVVLCAGTGAGTLRQRSDQG